MVLATQRLTLFISILLPLSCAVPTSFTSESDTHQLISDYIDDSLSPHPTQWSKRGLKQRIKSFLGFEDVERPLEIMTIPGYANWTSKGWNLRVHGRVYRNLPFTEDRLDDVASAMIPGFSRHNWTVDMRDSARNSTLALLSDPEKDIPVPYRLSKNGQTIKEFTTPPSDRRGGFDTYLQLNDPVLKPGEGNGVIQTLDEHTSLSIIGNATAYFVPDTGVTVIADIDDILRLTQIWYARKALVNSFGSRFVPLEGMPEIMNSWAGDPTVHFHYITTTPFMVGRSYMSFIFNHFPHGSFDFRVWKNLTIEQIFAIRRYHLIRIFQTFPKRKFILLGDTSNQDAMKAYPEMATLFPGQISCILMRNITASDPNFPIPYDTTGFKPVLPSTYQFFRTSDDLRGIDFINGGCRNNTITQNITFGKHNGWSRKSMGLFLNELLGYPLVGIGAFFDSVGRKLGIGG
ncbi:hypothetical protein FRC03_002003 [Tulasnella sp. 419]|nr:hypothetical protein FRC03_002003 [Tulasnella sp. 419]